MAEQRSCEIDAPLAKSSLVIVAYVRAKSQEICDEELMCVWTYSPGLNHPLRKANFEIKSINTTR